LNPVSSVARKIRAVARLHLEYEAGVKRLSDGDSTDHVFMLTLAVRLGPVVMFLLLAIEWAFYRSRLLWLLIPDIAATALVVLGVYKIFGGLSIATSAVFFPSGKGTPPQREYSELEALIAGGHFVEAADCYRAIIEDEPANIEARVRLGRLLEGELHDPSAAEAVFRSVRALHPTPQEDWISSNALIDLYHRIGNRERLKAELLGLSRRFRNTDAGASARRRLDELNAEDGVAQPAPNS